MTGTRKYPGPHRENSVPCYARGRALTSATGGWPWEISFARAHRRTPRTPDVPYYRSPDLRWCGSAGHALPHPRSVPSDWPNRPRETGLRWHHPLVSATHPVPTADFAAPPAPLRRVADEVLDYPVSRGMSQTHVRIWFGRAPEGDRVVVVLGALRDGVGVTNFVESIAELVQPRLPQHLGPEAVLWLQYRADDLSHGVRRVGFRWVRRGRGSSGRWTPSAPEWSTASIADVERLIGAPLECYPDHAYTSAVVTQWARGAGQIPVVHDSIDLGGPLTALRCLDMTDVDAETAPTAATACQVLATETRDRLEHLRQSSWDDGTTPTASPTDRPTRFAARLIAPSLTADDQELLQRYPDDFVWPRSLFAARDLRPLLGRLKVWRDDTGEHADDPAPAVHEAVSCAHRCVRRSVENWGHHAVDLPDTEVRLFTLPGRWDRRYLDTVGWETAEHDTPRHRALRARFLDTDRPGLIFGTDPWQHLVAYHRGSRFPEAFAVEWPLRPTSDAIPDDAQIVADGAVGDRPAYIALPDGELAPLPAHPDNPGWNFGYGGSGPCALVESVLRFLTLTDGATPNGAVADWLLRQVSSSDQDELRIRIGSIRAAG